MADFRWTSQGGTLVDGNGDIATTVSATEELESMAATRIKAAFNSWKLYQIGANLQQFIGSSTGINQNTVLSIQRAVTASLTNQFLPAGSFTVQTVVLGKEVQILVYLAGKLLVSQTVTL